MKVAIVSDTHYAVGRFHRLLRQLKQDNIHYVVHAGDYDGVGVEDVICTEKEINFYITLGNCDNDWQKNELLKNQSHVLLGDVISFQLGDIVFGVAHIPGEAQRALSGHAVQVFVFGHTHKIYIGNHANGLSLNPGSLMSNRSYLILDLPSLDISDHTIEA